MKKKNTKINILTYGTFDLLHHGHENIIERAIKLAGGGKVVIGVSSDRWNELKGKIAYESQEIRVKNLLDKYKKNNIEIILEDHADHMEQWLDDYDKYEIDFILMGGDHLTTLHILDGKKTPTGREARILFTNRTPGISSTQLRKQLYNEKHKYDQKNKKECS